MPAAGILPGKGANIIDLFCTIPKVLKLQEVSFGIYKNIGRRKHQRGATSQPQGWRARPPTLWPPWQASGAHLCPYGVFYPGKNQEEAFGTKRRRLEAEPWRNQSRALAELFCRGNIPSGGGNRHHRHHHRSSHREGVKSPSTSSPAPSPLKP